MRGAREYKDNAESEDIVRGVHIRVQRHARAESWPLLVLCALALALPAAGAAGRESASTAGPDATTPRAGLREAASATVGHSDASFHVRHTGGGLVARSGGLTTTFGRAGVVIGAAGQRISLA